MQAADAACTACRGTRQLRYPRFRDRVRELLELGVKSGALLWSCGALKRFVKTAKTPPGWWLVGIDESRLPV